MSGCYISLGAGVQSTTLVHLAPDLEDPPRAAIFADTRWEPPAVYEHLDRLESRSPIPIHRTSDGDLRSDAIEGATGEGHGRFASMPLYVRNPDGSVSMLRRQCTREYKIAPVKRMIRKLERLGPRGRPDRPVRLCLGISLDEIQRAKPSRVQWLERRYPLIEERMSREGCKRWLRAHGLEIPPRSSCIGCPYHSDAYWRDMKRNRPEEWADAVEFDRTIRELPKVEGPCFLHRSGQPLEAVDLRTAEDRGQTSFLGECEGVCGV